MLEVSVEKSMPSPTSKISSLFISKIFAFKLLTQSLVAPQRCDGSGFVER